MKIIIIGNGQLGSYLYKNFVNKYNVNIVSVPQFDIRNINQCNEIVCNNDIIINCAAYTFVDKAESQYDLCMQINCNGVMNLSYFCRKYGKRLIHISTQAVYGSNDEKYIPIKQTDQMHPVNIYGLSKLNADNNIKYIMQNNYIILRPAWLFGPNSDHNFISKIKTLLQTKEKIKVVNDQIGSLTSVQLVADVIEFHIKNDLPFGDYNIANDQFTSRYDNAVLIKKIINSSCNVLPCNSQQFSRIANVAKNSCLDCSKLKKYYDRIIPNWEEDVAKMLNCLM